MPEILVAFASDHGHTHHVADRIAGALRSAGHDVRVADLARDPRPDPATADAVVVGASLHAGRYQPVVIGWVRDHAAQLRAVPSAFFSVSLSAAEDTERTRRNLGDILTGFVARTGWRPDRVAQLGGALQYREYAWPLRLLMRAIAMRHEAPTDPRQDVVLTDWDQVDAFAREVIGLVEARGAPTP
jgi:menaquinone-dependent protoporphyrinogen oxidase